MAENFQSVNAESEYNPKVLVGVGVVLTVLPIIVVALRFFTRWHFNIGFGKDDWSILVALVLCIGAGVVEILTGTIGGMGSHQELGPDGQLIHTQTLYNYEKLRYSNEIITTINLGLVKISILLFYRRLFVTRAFKITSMSMIVFLIAWTIAFTSVMAAQCVPASAFWNLFEIGYPSNCINVQKFYEILAWFDLALDVVVLALPIPIILFLRMSWRKKIAVIDVLLLGIVVLGSGIARLVSFLEVIHETQGNFVGYYHDTLWWTAGPLFWLFAENSIAIIGACLPTLAPLWSRRFRNVSVRQLNDANDSTFFTKISEKLRTNPPSIRESETATPFPERRSSHHEEFPQHLVQIYAERTTHRDQPVNEIRVDQTYSVDRNYPVEREHLV